MKRYYEMDVIITGKIRVPIDDYNEDKDYVVECIEMTDDLVDIAENIQRTDFENYRVHVLKNSIKEI